MGPLARVVAALALGAGVVASDARAKLNPEFDRLTARAGDRVRLVFQGGVPSGESVAVYLITVHQARALAWPNGRGPIAFYSGTPPERLLRHPLGDLAPGETTVRFTVPPVAPGRYTTLLWLSNRLYGPSRLGDTPDRFVRRPDRGFLRIKR